jgi:hypothetical protein
MIELPNRRKASKNRMSKCCFKDRFSLIIQRFESKTKEKKKKCLFYVTMKNIDRENVVTRSHNLLFFGEKNREAMMNRDTVLFEDDEKCTQKHQFLHFTRCSFFMNRNVKFF